MMRILSNKQKKGTGAQGDKGGGGNRFLISVTVQGSTGPIRSIVKEEQLVSTVIQSTLKSYAREGRFPALGSDQDQFLLYCSNRGSDGPVSALCPGETIGKSGARNFILCKKTKADTPATYPRSITGKGWLKKWLSNSLSSRAALCICERRVGREG